MEWLRANPSTRGAIGVDREKEIINGYVVAQRGPFKSDGRGEFDDQALAKIVELGNAAPAGLKVRLSHPTESDDGAGKFLGRSKHFRLDGDKVRADLHIAGSSHKTPSGDLGGYVMDRAEEDPTSFGSSLVLRTDKQMRLNADGTRMLGPDGQPLPPLWRPTELHASDVVDEGDAVHDGFLSVEDLPDAMYWQASAQLDRLFLGKEKAFATERLHLFVQRYLSSRFPVDEQASPTVKLRHDSMRARLRLKTQ